MWYGSIAAACMGSLLLALPAKAEQISELTIGNWNGGAYTHTQTGEFSHCAASANYKSGVTLVFAINRDLTWALGLANDSWKLTEGDTYPVQYRLDRGKTYEGTATAIAPNQVKIQLPGDDSLFNRFRRGNMLTIVAANQTMRFSLNQTSKMLSSLFNCAKHWRNRYSKPTDNPFGNSGSDGGSDGGGNPFQ
ncbi:hypothetical protein [uncultured Roseibium sp.]|uniref:hypothetical protein n=1 Tax=uncultured Roseibium sp. TaxID=1936171 RepID=UPI003217DA91